MLLSLSPRRPPPGTSGCGPGEFGKIIARILIFVKKWSFCEPRYGAKLAASLASSRSLSLRQLRPHRRRNDRPEELDRAQDCGLRLGADLHLHQIALVAEDLVLGEDFGDRLVGRPPTIK